MIQFLQSLLSGANQGLLWALLTIGVFITFRILDFADLTIEGSFATGTAVAAIMISKGCEPILSTLVAFVAGALAGACTGLLHTKLKIPPILSGIITMTALYSINFRIMGTSNISIIRQTTILTYIQNLFGINQMYATTILSVVTIAIVIAVLYWFFGTEVGSGIRATGSNEKMCRAQGVNTDKMKILALMISNALVALSGALVAQQQSYGDVSMGVGAIVTGLAAVIIGETIINGKFPFWLKMIGLVLGSIIYRVIITLVINANLLKPSDVKLLTAVMVVIALSLPLIKNGISKFMKKRKDALSAKLVAELENDNGGDKNA